MIKNTILCTYLGYLPIHVQKKTKIKIIYFFFKINIFERSISATQFQVKALILSSTST